MKLEDLDRVAALKAELQMADEVLAAFLATPSQTVAAWAHSAGRNGNDFGRRCSVELMPVSTEVAVSAARRSRSKIVSQLAELGVTVEE